jgi:hypothetical protein
MRRALLAGLCLAGMACGTSTRPDDATEYELELIWLGTPPSEQVRSSFDRAGNTIRATIVGALTSVALPPSFTNLDQCGLKGYPEISRTPIRGLRIYAVVESIDGVGGTLGSAGPCLIRNDDTPALSVMRFDDADVQNLLSSGRLASVVLHEMLHAVGFGTVWYDKAVIDTLANPNDARFTGVFARQSCRDFNGGETVCANSVPVHSADGDGSRFSHWRESVFTNELMTPFLGSGVTPLSATTIGSLEDLGYDVSYETANPFTLPTTTALRADTAAAGIRLGEPMLPRWKLDGAGRLMPYRPRR